MAKFKVGDRVKISGIYSTAVTSWPGTIVDYLDSRYYVKIDSPDPWYRGEKWCCGKEDLRHYKTFETALEQICEPGFGGAE